MSETVFNRWRVTWTDNDGTLRWAFKPTWDEAIETATQRAMRESHPTHRIRLEHVPGALRRGERT